VTVLKHFGTGDHTIRHVNIFRWYIDMVEKLNFHEVAVTLRMMRCQPVILVEIERDDVPEGKSLLPIQSNELAVELDWS
jgi:hypothetical protein